MGFLEKALRVVEKFAGGSQTAHLAKLKQRLSDLLNEKEWDPDRLHREAAFLADRCDITEETVRMQSHLDAFKKKLNAPDAVGRELDFLCQEMNREVNTMGSKSQQIEISQQTVFMKGELEKIREQVQNIE
jgi:uncharacterized protein (TIGR00255 family)